jgi:hypothetical protein
MGGHGGGRGLAALQKKQRYPEKSAIVQKHAFA